MNADIIIIDPWPSEQLQEFYKKIIEFIEEVDPGKIIIASYESGTVDVTLTNYLKDKENVIYNSYLNHNDISDGVVIAGISWQKCVHARYLGIVHLLLANKTIISNPSLIIRTDDDVHYPVTNEDFHSDWVNWVAFNKNFICAPTIDNVRYAITHKRHKLLKNIDN